MKTFVSSEIRLVAKKRLASSTKNRLTNKYRRVKVPSSKT